MRSTSPFRRRHEYDRDRKEQGQTLCNTISKLDQMSMDLLDAATPRRLKYGNRIVVTPDRTLNVNGRNHMGQPALEAMAKINKAAIKIEQLYSLKPQRQRGEDGASHFKLNSARNKKHSLRKSAPWFPQQSNGVSRFHPQLHSNGTASTKRRLKNSSDWHNSRQVKEIFESPSPKKQKSKRVRVSDNGSLTVGNRGKPRTFFQPAEGIQIFCGKHLPPNRSSVNEEQQNSSLETKADCGNGRDSSAEKKDKGFVQEVTVKEPNMSPLSKLSQTNSALAQAKQKIARLQHAVKKLLRERQRLLECIVSHSGTMHNIEKNPMNMPLDMLLLRFLGEQREKVLHQMDVQEDKSAENVVTIILNSVKDSLGKSGQSGVLSCNKEVQTTYEESANYLDKNSAAKHIMHGTSQSEASSDKKVQTVRKAQEIMNSNEKNFKLKETVLTPFSMINFLNDPPRDHSKGSSKADVNKHITNSIGSEEDEKEDAQGQDETGMEEKEKDLEEDSLNEEEIDVDEMSYIVEVNDHDSNRKLVHKKKENGRYQEESAFASEDDLDAENFCGDANDDNDNEERGAKDLQGAVSIRVEVTETDEESTSVHIKDHEFNEERVHSKVENELLDVEGANKSADVLKEVDIDNYHEDYAREYGKDSQGTVSEACRKITPDYRQNKTSTKINTLEAQKTKLKKNEREDILNNGGNEWEENCVKMSAEKVEGLDTECGVADPQKGDEEETPDEGNAYGNVVDDHDDDVDDDHHKRETGRIFEEKTASVQESNRCDQDCGTEQAADQEKQYTGKHKKLQDTPDYRQNKTSTKINTLEAQKTKLKKNEREDILNNGGNEWEENCVKMSAEKVEGLDTECGVADPQKGDEEETPDEGNAYGNVVDDHDDDVDDDHHKRETGRIFEEKTASVQESNRCDQDCGTEQAADQEKQYTGKHKKLQERDIYKEAEESDKKKRIKTVRNTTPDYRQNKTSAKINKLEAQKTKKKIRATHGRVRFVKPGSQVSSPRRAKVNIKSKSTNEMATFVQPKSPSKSLKVEESTVRFKDKPKSTSTSKSKSESQSQTSPRSTCILVKAVKINENITLDNAIVYSSQESALEDNNATVADVDNADLSTGGDLGELSDSSEICHTTSLQDINDGSTDMKGKTPPWADPKIWVSVMGGRGNLQQELRKNNTEPSRNTGRKVQASILGSDRSGQRLSKNSSDSLSKDRNKVHELDNTQRGLTGENSRSGRQEMAHSGLISLKQISSRNLLPHSKEISELNSDQNVSSHSPCSVNQAKIHISHRGSVSLQIPHHKSVNEKSLHKAVAVKFNSKSAIEPSRSEAKCDSIVNPTPELATTPGSHRDLTDAQISLIETRLRDEIFEVQSRHNNISFKLRILRDTASIANDTASIKRSLVLEESFRRFDEDLKILTKSLDHISTHISRLSRQDYSLIAHRLWTMLDSIKQREYDIGIQVDRCISSAQSNIVENTSRKLHQSEASLSIFESNSVLRRTNRLLRGVADELGIGITSIDSTTNLISQSHQGHLKNENVGALELLQSTEYLSKSVEKTLSEVLNASR